MAEIVGLHGAKIFEPGADPNIVAVFDEWRERARSGELVGIAIAGLNRDGSVGQTFQGLKSRSLVGVLFSIATKLSRLIDDGD